MLSSALALSSTNELLDLVSTVFHGENNLDCVLISHTAGPKDQATDGRRMFQSFSSPSSASDYLALKRQSGCSISLIDAESPDNIGHLLKWPKVLKNHATLLTSPEPPNLPTLSEINHPLLWRPARMVFLYLTLIIFLHDQYSEALLRGNTKLSCTARLWGSRGSQGSTPSVPATARRAS